jgi:hypothetical protein
MEIKKFNLFLEGADNKRMDFILDKITRFGKNSLSKNEKEYLDSIAKGEVKENEGYNEYIINILRDFNNGKITEKILINYLKTYISYEDLINFITLLVKDGKLDSLIKK